MTEQRPSAERIAAPRLPEQPAPYRFPVVASLAPVLVSVLLFAVTGSAYMLLFAVLGPVTAVASLADSRLGARRTARRERARFLADAEIVAERIGRAHETELAELRERVPGALELQLRRGADPDRWTGTAESPVPLALGTGVTASRLRLDRPADRTEPADVLAAELDRLDELAAGLAEAPVHVDGRLGVGVAGPAMPALALARSLIMQGAWALSPARHALLGSGTTAESSWLGQLPHALTQRDRAHGLVAEFAGDGGEPVLTIAVADSPEQLPASCRVVVVIGADGMSTLVRHPDAPQRRAFRPAFLGREQARSWARRMLAEAAAEGLAGLGETLPDRVPLTPLLADSARPRSGLGCRFALGDAGPLDIDLVRDGPHAVIGGTTGSGKSELLISWVLAMAAAHSPQRLAFLLVDFKGGSAFTPLAALPHTTGIITDLDETAAGRALASLRAELRHRERVLAQAGVRDIAELDSLARLVIVVDEFAAVMDLDPELHALFADLAARGRSLGVHLVLCTQRPAGTVRDSVLANAELRLSLRVNNRADSEAVIGSPAAAELPAAPRGRAMIRLPGAPAQLVQVALAESGDASLIADRWAGTGRPRRPWCEPLPAIVPLDRLDPAEGIGFGLLDLPEQQAQVTAGYLPGRDGHLLVLGGSGSGKSTLLAALAGGGGQWLPSRPAPAWDTLEQLAASLEQPGPARLLLLDDLDALLPRFGEEHRAAVLERLSVLLREGPARGLHCVIAAQRLSAELQQAIALVPSRLLLRLPSRDEHLLAGGDRCQWDPGLPPGGGHWRGHRLQVALSAIRRPPDPEPAQSLLDPSGSLAVVAGRAGAWAARLREAGWQVTALAEAAPDAGLRVARASARPVALLGEVEDWQSRWGALAALRDGFRIVFAGCAIAEIRALARSRVLPPPLEPGLAWALAEDGGFERVRMP